MSRYRRFSKRSYGAYRASQHVSERHALSSSLGGIDKDVERIFLNLPNLKLETVLLRYGCEHGASALSYARNTYPRPLTEESANKHDKFCTERIDVRNQDRSTQESL